MPDAAQDDLRLTFDGVPEIYDRARPEYPPALFDRLFAYAGASPAAGQLDVLEIGPGTGKATRPLLDRGATVTAVEIGPQLARFLRAKFASNERLSVLNAAFEDADLAIEQYDLVVSATAFHWIDAAVRLHKSRDILRPGGTLAIVGTNQIKSEADRGFFDHVFPIYRRYRPDEKHVEVPGEDVVPGEYREIEASGLFLDVELHRYRWDQTYTATVYADLVRSYSNTETEAGPREALIADLCAVIDEEYGGSIVRPLVITLSLGRRPL